LTLPGLKTRGFLEQPRPLNTVSFLSVPEMVLFPSFYPIAEVCRIDLDNPLKFGEIQAIEAQWVAPGNAVLAVMRPNGRGGYEVLYRTSVLAVKLDSRRLAIRTVAP